jgi:hypothetical protein
VLVPRATRLPQEDSKEPPPEEQPPPPPDSERDNREDTEQQQPEPDLAEILVEVLKENAAVLRGFAGRSSLATYLAVIARRTAVRMLSQADAHVVRVDLPTAGAAVVAVAGACGVQQLLRNTGHLPRVMGARTKASRTRTRRIFSSAGRTVSGGAAR